MTLIIRLSDRYRNPSIRGQTKLDDEVEPMVRMKWIWAGCVSRRYDDRWSKRVIQWCSINSGEDREDRDDTLNMTIYQK